jgi:phospholipid N-methyltransferase
MQALNFIKNFLLHPKHTGAIAASSSRLADLITDCAELTQAATIVEFGPGTGVFTEKILKKSPKGALIMAIEFNGEFATMTQKRFPTVHVIHDSATEAKKHLKTFGKEKCDRIVSGLPWASFEEDLQNRLLQTVDDILVPGGIFVTFAYLQGLLIPAGQRFRKKLKENFVSVGSSRVEWLNAPPAFVYIGRK